MSDEMQLTTTDFMKSLQAVAQLDEQIAARYESIYPCAYVSVAHPMNQSNDMPGDLRVSFSRDEKLSTKVLAVFPVGMIGTSGGNDTKNPTPRNWLTPFDNTELQNKYGRSMCHSSGNFEPDPMYHDRTLTHPDANNRQFVQAVTEYNGTELHPIPLTVSIKDVHDCRQCVFGNTWYGVKDPTTGKVPVVLRRVCNPVPSGVVYMVGAMGTGLFEKAHRVLTQIPMQNQAARAAFSSKNNDSFIKGLGLQTALANVLLAKPINNLPAYAVQAGSDVFLFPVLIGGVVATVEREGSNPGKIAVPFAFNTAGVVRKYMESNSESDVNLRLAGAVRQAVAEFTAITKPQDVKSYSEQLFILLNATTPHVAIPESMALHEEFKQAKFDYEQNGGMEKLTTPFRKVETAPTTVSEENFQEQQQPIETPVVEDSESAAKILQQLNNASFDFAPEAVENESDNVITGFFGDTSW